MTDIKINPIEVTPKARFEPGETLINKEFNLVVIVTNKTPETSEFFNAMIIQDPKNSHGIYSHQCDWKKDKFEFYPCEFTIKNKI